MEENNNTPIKDLKIDDKKYIVDTINDLKNYSKSFHSLYNLSIALVVICIVAGFIEIGLGYIASGVSILMLGIIEGSILAAIFLKLSLISNHISYVFKHILKEKYNLVMKVKQDNTDEQN